MSGPLNIVFIHPTLSYQGGAELSLLWLATGLAQRGHTITIITGSVAEGLVKDLPGTIHILNIDKSTDPYEWLTLPPLIMDVVAKADIISPHNYPSYLWLPAVTQPLPPVVLFCQEPPQCLYASITQRHFLNMSFRELGGYLPLLSQIRLKGNVVLNRLRHRHKRDRQAIGKCDLVLANSSFTADNFRRIHGRQAEVCHLGIPDYFWHDQQQAEHANPSGSSNQQILLPGRLSAVKNVGIVLEALFLVQNKHYGLLKPDGVTIIGEGWQQRFLANKLVSYGLTDVVRLKQQVSHHEMKRLYRQHQIILYVPFDEPFGLVALEAMASAKPIIGSDQGGISETVVHNQTGLLVNPGSADELGAAIVSLLQKPDLCQSFGQAGNSRFKEHFTLDHFVNTFQHYCYQAREH